MKNVLLLVHDDTAQEARLQAALDITRAISGHLHCVDVTPLPLVADSMLAGVPSPVVYDEAPREEQNRARIEARLAAEDVSWTIEASRGDYASCLKDAMKTADVLVLNRTHLGPLEPDVRSIVGNVIADNDGLVLAVPPDGKGIDVGGSAVIAWDGSQPAMRTMQRSVPLLALAKSVTLVQVGRLPADAIPADAGAEYLSRHGIKPEVLVVPEGAGPSVEISRAAGRLGAAYCVMGAFGHGRLREAVFGGTTRDMLETSGVSLLLGH